jgi:hypothetical protein
VAELVEHGEPRRGRLDARRHDRDDLAARLDDERARPRPLARDEREPACGAVAPRELAPDRIDLRRPDP